MCLCSSKHECSPRCVTIYKLQTGVQQMPWDPTLDFKFMFANTKHFMSLWRSYKPTIAKVHGHAVAGGSDIALCW